jgi:hypothetical protein
LAVGYFIIVSIPFALGEYPVVLVGSALKSAMMSSVAATPDAETVTTEAHVAEDIEPVPRTAVPLAMVCVRFAFEFWKHSPSQIEGDASG